MVGIEAMPKIEPAVKSLGGGLCRFRPVNGGKAVTKKSRQAMPAAASGYETIKDGAIKAPIRDRTEIMAANPYRCLEEIRSGTLITVNLVSLCTYG